MWWQPFLTVIYDTESKAICGHVFLSWHIINRNNSQNKCIKLSIYDAITFISNILFILTHISLIPRSLKYAVSAGQLSYWTSSPALFQFSKAEASVSQHIHAHDPFSRIYTQLWILPRSALYQEFPKPYTKSGSPSRFLQPVSHKCFLHLYMVM